jgi:hypothetical protein
MTSLCNFLSIITHIFSKSTVSTSLGDIRVVHSSHFQAIFSSFLISFLISFFKNELENDIKNESKMIIFLVLALRGLD